MRRPSKHRASRSRERSRKAADCGTIGSSTTSTLPVSNHANVVADMFRCERDLTVMIGRVRERLDAELIAAREDRTPFKDLAFEVQRRLALPTTAHELERLSRALRQRTTVAHRRGIASARAPGTSDVAGDDAYAHDGDMNTPLPPYRRRVVDEWYSPDGRPPDVEDMNDDQLDGDDDEFEDDDQDHDLGDPGDGNQRGPGPR